MRLVAAEVTQGRKEEGGEGRVRELRFPKETFLFTLQHLIGRTRNMVHVL